MWRGPEAQPRRSNTANCRLQSADAPQRTASLQRINELLRKDAKGSKGFQRLQRYSFFDRRVDHRHDTAAMEVDDMCHPCKDQDEVIEVEEEDDEVLEAEDDGEAVAQAEGAQRLCQLMSNTLFLGFEAHVRDVEAARERRREALAFKSLVEDASALADDGAEKQSQDEIDGLGVWRPEDEYQGVRVLCASRSCGG